MGGRSLRKRGPVVSTSLGKVEGSLIKTENGRKVYSYRGIPYGCPPLGERRFKKPEPVSAWKHTRDCRREAKKSLQPNILFPEKHLLAEGGEDCLYLSVFTKNAPGKDIDTGLLPVVVFLHGGAFLVGSCQADLYGPQVLLDHPFVLVGVNYRLGPLGWLSLGCEEAPGNLGLWDQRLALLWVRDHISAFGGDPSCVTLMGESAGAMSAMLHMVAPPSAGLFHRVVALSGTPSNPLLHLSRKPAAYARTFAKRLGCDEGLDDEGILKFLQSVTAKQILKNGLIFKDWDNAAPMPWVPVDDSHLKEPFLPLSFYDAVKAGKIEKVPVIMGCCKDEGLILSAPFQRYKRQLDILSSDWDTWAPLLFFGRERELVGEKEAEIVREVRERYWPSVREERIPPEVNLARVKEIYSFSYFVSPMDTDSQLLVAAGLPVFNFLLTQPASFSLSSLFSKKPSKVVRMFAKGAFGLTIPTPKGVGHGDDLAYIFPMAQLGLPRSVVTPPQQKTRQNFLQLLHSFATSGKPMLSDEQVWQEVKKEDDRREILEISESLRMANRAETTAELLFWKGVWERVREATPPLTNEPPRELHAKIACKRIQFAEM